MSLGVEVGNLHCCLLFGNESEYESLVIKILSEKDYIEYWIIVENTFDLKGREKRKILKDKLAGDSRLSDCLDRVLVVEINQNFYGQYKHSFSKILQRLVRKLIGRWNPVLEARWRQMPSMFAEFSQRDHATEVLREVAGVDDYALICDYDEILNLEGENLHYLKSRLDSMRPRFVGVGRLRFVFDYCNLQLGKARFTPLIRVSEIISGRIPISDSRTRDDFLPLGARELVYEYSYCQNKHAVQEKSKHFAHDSIEEISAIQQAFDMNHVVMKRKSDRLRSVHWCEMTKLSEFSHPSLIVEEFENLKTDSIDPAYNENRQSRYPSYFGS